MYFLSSETCVVAVRAFWDTVKGAMPTDVSIKVENTGDLIEDTTGELTGAWSQAPVAAVLGSSLGKYGAPCGGIVRWETSTILDGHRLRGRTFIVPMSSDFYATDGSLDVAGIAAFQTAGSDLQSAEAATFVV